MGFIFLPFCNFLYCVLSFYYCFLLLPAEGDVGLFFIVFKIIILYILNNFLGILFTF
jgi:hypothetical protein